MSFADYYAILGVPHNASLTQIKRAYRRLARLYHPDLNRQVHEEHIKRLNEAYDVLSDFRKRAIYDIQQLEEMRHAIIMDALRRQPRQALHRMSWPEGISGFFRELKRGLQD
ncbi:hypothetical protein EPA93_36380 [Ktedonosporobacter rubrisoli]|uniref:J domain-containing protein n=1 Tax=Ktedonosporobacter rubrisoli TaxID=2509675 RepID=A0A4P6JZH3_KTERU|nr:DnaJ domain-containing protein [Ktedonosporobacter rubrisoli]QBD81159.1 hypothetical protein EPA93_36380 [Ktedonosporobacter rubrisoli]